MTIAKEIMTSHVKYVGENQTLADAARHLTGDQVAELVGSVTRA